MSVNSALVTEAAQAVAEATLAAYGNGVAAHTGGDWGRHNTLRVHAQTFTDDQGHTASAHVLRMLLTGDNVATAVVVPLLAVGASTTPGSLPQIVVQPASVTVAVGGQLTLIVAAISEAPMSYQWYKDDVAISGATSSSYLNTGVAEIDQGTYHCVVTNQYGSVTSGEAEVTVGS